jgi:hypothetical protein
MRVYSKKYHAVYARKWREENPEACSVVGCRKPCITSLCEFHTRTQYAKNRKSSERRKLRVLTHYGKSRKLLCCWRGCKVCDPDMLSLDHINNDGAEDRKSGFEGCGAGLYRKVEREGYPEGFQTLCHNHQWKKELMKRREDSKS